ncbi:aminoacyl-histidine dipeptidase [Oceanobacillus arenosus]|uniref:Cytosol non-specific dipeptidase n=1 Tax=Oceanobacillus arenosus TaxID=1229153 RepID=A0A3D8PWX2_9BACI|nr:aminoacyl-histidine dipeptidase [Oceanobacillus arenosus]RDW20272.1 aminoacyl-histidine dipeptidase [Oceanobacillus arenosus]
MYNSLQKLNEIPIFHFFSEISQIPRGSGNEKEISDYLVRFAYERGLEVIQDEALNVIIKKPATEGYENGPTVIIQGHMDMVCEKNEGTIHDFSKDPLKLRIKDDMLYATDTTLGADNGVAVAYQLALLDAVDIAHPALKIVITTEEETTMKGALAVDSSLLEGKILINIDSEEDNKLLVSSAGGLQTVLEIPIIEETTHEEYVSYNLSVKGLIGGHSGIEIDQERGNAIKIMGRLLYDLSTNFNLVIQHVRGGMASNAIPREVMVTIALPEGEVGLLHQKIQSWTHTLKKEFAISDPDVFIELKQVEYSLPTCFSEETKRKVITSLMLLPNGIQNMSMDLKGLVESSVNVGKVYTTKTSIIIESDVRSSMKSRKYAITDQSRVVAESLDCNFRVTSDYPEWPYNPNSAIRQLFEKIYFEREGKNIEVVAVHAGIECGIFIEKTPELDAISIGPDMFDVHTPNEHVSIPSMLNNWEYFLAVLKQMK